MSPYAKGAKTKLLNIKWLGLNHFSMVQLWIKKLFKKMGQSYKDQYDVDLNASLGSGGAAKVYRCKRKSDGQEFAIKLLDEKSQDKISRFKDEIEVMNNCEINGIKGVMPIIDFNIEECWYVMPIARSLSDEIKDWRKKIQAAVPQNMYKDDIVGCAVDIFRNIAVTLSAVHKLGYIHRDIKPKNLYRLDGTFLIGDFGIVDIPDGNHNTKKGDKLGTWNTIAPEVLRDASKATPAADVYSLAKSLWMYLASDEDGFDGRYDVEYSSISLHDIQQYRGKYLVEIDDLLHDATQEEPSKRPTMDGFIARLDSWKDTDGNLLRRNKQEWNFIYEILFRGMKPAHTVLTERKDIIKTLNALSRYGVLNYSMLPSRGGLKLEGASIAPEEGCIYLDYQYIFICRPKRLIIRSFVGDELWNYFYLEFDKLPYVFEDRISEELIEDKPANYIDAMNWVYRVYDYETGEPLPADAKRVERYCHGAIVFVAKSSIYNRVTQTADGRHADCSEEDFYSYICSMRKDFRSISTEEELAQLFDKYSSNPFKPDRTWGKDFQEIDTSHVGDLIKNHYNEIDFADLLIEESEASVKYCFKLNLMEPRGLFDDYSTDYFLCKDGRVKHIKEDSDEIYYVYGSENGINLKNSLHKRLEEFSNAHGQEYKTIDAYFQPELFLIKVPKHIFNYSELNKAAMAADDRHDNYVVINESGYVEVVEDNYEFYPVRSKRINSYNRYIGRYSNGLFAKMNINTFLAQWLTYLETKKGISSSTDTKYEQLSPREIKDLIKGIVNN
jgi:serine/threonine protein kinase